MVRGEAQSFTATIQNKGNNGRMAVEIPKEFRKFFKSGASVKVTMKELI